MPITIINARFRFWSQITFQLVIFSLRPTIRRTLYTAMYKDDQRNSVTSKSMVSIHTTLSTTLNLGAIAYVFPPQYQDLQICHPHHRSFILPNRPRPTYLVMSYYLFHVPKSSGQPLRTCLQHTLGAIHKFFCCSYQRPGHLPILIYEPDDCTFCPPNLSG